MSSSSPAALPHTHTVIDPDLEVSVADQFVSVDNDAVFRCQLGAQTRHLFQVVGWLEDGQTLVQTTGAQLSWFGGRPAPLPPLGAGSGGGNQLQLPQQQRALFLPEGQLYIQRVQLKDANKSYRCQIKNLLSSIISLSPLSGRLFVTGKLTLPSPAGQRATKSLDRDNNIDDGRPLPRTLAGRPSSIEKIESAQFGQSATKFKSRPQVAAIVFDGGTKSMTTTKMMMMIAGANVSIMVPFGWQWLQIHPALDVSRPVSRRGEAKTRELVAAASIA